MDTHGGDRVCDSIMSSGRTVGEAQSERGLIASQNLCNQEKLVNPYHRVDAHVDALFPLRRKLRLCMPGLKIFVFVRVMNRDG